MDVAIRLDPVNGHGGLPVFGTVSQHLGFPKGEEPIVAPAAGTVVRLNTEEIGRVVAVNRNHPLRPRVEVVADSKGHRLPAPKVIDLSEAPFLYITGPVTEGSR